MDQKNMPHHIGFAVENDYIWDWLGRRDGEFFYIGTSSNLKDLRTPTVDEYLKTDLTKFEMPDDLRVRIDEINAVARETQAAARKGDIDTVRRNYKRFGKLTTDVPYDSSVVIADWKEEGYLK